eukprot:6193208-Pleurochrysis_carterae.AAC.3
MVFGFTYAATQELNAPFHDESERCTRPAPRFEAKHLIHRIIGECFGCLGTANTRCVEFGFGSCAGGGGAINSGWGGREDRKRVADLPSGTRVEATRSCSCAQIAWLRPPSSSKSLNMAERYARFEIDFGLSARARTDGLLAAAVARVRLGLSVGDGDVCDKVD